MKQGSVITIWFGKEVDIESVKREVRKLQSMGYTVRAPFYIGYNIDNMLVSRYLKNSLDISDYLYLMGSEGFLLEEIVEYANEIHKEIIRKDLEGLCCLM
jgi:hypothetical protein